MLKKWLIRLGLLVLIIVIFQGRLVDRMPDYQVYHTSGQRFVQGENLYQVNDGHFMHKYSPFFTMIFLPIFMLPLPIAKFVWIILMLFLLYKTYLIYMKRISPDVKFPVWAVSLTFIFLFRFYAWEVELGNANFLIAFLLGLTLKYLLDDKQELSGIFVGLAALIKPPVLIFWVYLLLKKKWKAALCAVGTILTGLLLPALKYGFTGNIKLHYNWWQLLAGSSEENYHGVDIQSYFGLYYKLVDYVVPQLQKYVSLNVFVLTLIVLTLLIFLRIFYQGKKQKLVYVSNPIILEFSIIMSFMMLFSPQGWHYGLLHLTPFLLVLFYVLVQLRRSGIKDLGLAVFMIILVSTLFLSDYNLLVKDMYFWLMNHGVITIGGITAILTGLYLREKNYA